MPRDRFEPLESAFSSPDTNGLSRQDSSDSGFRGQAPRLSFSLCCALRRDELRICHACADSWLAQPEMLSVGGSRQAGSRRSGSSRGA